MDSLTLNVITPFKIEIMEKPHSFAPRPLIFKLEQDALKFSDICVSWSSPKTVYLNAKNRSFENVLAVTFREII